GGGRGRAAAAAPAGSADPRHQRSRTVSTAALARDSRARLSAISSRTGRTATTPTAAYVGAAIASATAAPTRSISGKSVGETRDGGPSASSIKAAWSTEATAVGAVDDV